MTWEEYGAYLQENSSFADKQAMIVAGSAYNIDQNEIAQTLETTVSSVRSQKSKLSFEGMSDPVRTEVYKTPVPNVPTRFVGKAEYMLSEWPREGNGGAATVYVAVRDRHEHVIVVEEHTVSVQDTPEYMFGEAEKIRRERIYNSFNDFIRHSPHAPRKVVQYDTFEVETTGDLYSHPQQTLRR